MEHLTLPDQSFQPYLDRVARGLKVLPAAEQADLLREIASHLEDGKVAGEAPEALMARMGPPEEVAAALVRERQTAVDRQRSPLALFLMALKAAFLPLVAVLAVLLVVEFAFVWSTRPASGMLMHMAGMVAFVLPFGMLMLGAFGIPKLYRELSPEVFKRVLPRFSAAMMGLAVLATLVGYGMADGRFTPTGMAGPGVLSEMRQELETLRSERLAASRIHSYEGRRKLGFLEDKIESASGDYSMRVTLPVFPLGVTALGLVLGYWCRRSAFVLTAVAAGLGVIGQTVAGMVILMGSLGGNEFLTFSWTGVLLQWFLVMTALAIALFMDRGERHVQ